jgi:hypothetical protein
MVHGWEYSIPGLCMTACINTCTLQIQSKKAIKVKCYLLNRLMFKQNFGSTCFRKKHAKEVKHFVFRFCCFREIEIHNFVENLSHGACRFNSVPLHPPTRPHFCVLTY